MKELKKIRIIWEQFQEILTPSQKKWGIVVFILSVLGALAETLGVSVILPLVQVMLEPEQLLEIQYINIICKYLRINSTNKLLILVALCVIIVYILKNLYLCLLSYARVKYASKVQRELSVRMLYSYMKRGYSFFRINNTATLLRGTNGAVLGVYNIIYQFMRILAELLTILCIFLYVLYTDWKMAVSIIVLVGACLILLLCFFKNIVKKAGAQFYKYASLVNKWALQLFSGIKEVLVLDRKDFFVQNYEDAYRGQQNGQVKQTVASETPAFIIEGSCVTGIIIAVCIRVMGLEDPASYVPQLAAFAVAAFRLLPSVGRVSAYFNVCMFNHPALAEVYENVKEAKNYENEEIQNNQINETCQNIEFKNTVEIKDIVWKYPDGEKNVLDHISLKIHKGESIALVGTSGAGKSTLADILLGLFQPQEGEILVDNININSNKKAWLKLISFVPQSVYLIDDTIRRNIAFGIEDRDIQDDAVWKALEMAQMREYVLSLPNELDTIVGERGVRFSGGQMQRLAIARALYTNPDIMVLDEATSALDSETEQAVMDAIDSLQGEKTLIIIAHRLTTIKNCNKIYEISNGQAIQKSYDELV